MAAGKKRVDHVAWQIEVVTNEEWEDLTKLQGLVVVDVYSEWCGPCTAMASHLKEIKLQLGDDLLHCALAKADGITQLTKFRGRSEPTWLFLAGGEPVAMIRGANAPLIRKTLLAELQTEKEVLEQSRQRAVMCWDSFDLPSAKPETEDAEAEEEELTTAPDNWLELDALTLQGSYRLILDKLVEALNERSLEIVARSAVQLNKRDCLILWFPTSVEDESLAEWFDVTMQLLIAEVEPKTVHEEHSPEEVQEKVEISDSEEKKDDSCENTKSEIDPEECGYQTIEFRLIADPDEKEVLIKKLQNPEEEEEEEEEEAEKEEKDEGEHEEDGEHAEEKPEEDIQNGEEVVEETAKDEEQQHEELPIENENPEEKGETAAVEETVITESADSA